MSGSNVRSSCQANAYDTSVQHPYGSTQMQLSFEGHAALAQEVLPSAQAQQADFLVPTSLNVLADVSVDRLPAKLTLDFATICLAVLTCDLGNDRPKQLLCFFQSHTLGFAL